jgi:rare lipoprotein A
MKSVLKFSTCLALSCALTACIGGGSASELTSAQPLSGAASDDVVKIGKPYTIGGKTYTPKDVTDYDETGYASWYGDELAGQPTANGEVFVPRQISAAHRTLPLPSYVEVTSLDTGRTILVRVNDRGPFANDRIIDLSRGAAEQLGIVEQGVAGVRVRRVYPPSNDRALLQSGRQAQLRPETGDGLLTVLRDQLNSLPKPKVPQRRAAAPPAASPDFSATKPSAADLNARRLDKPENSTGNNRVDITNTAFVIQVAAFSSRDRAAALATQIGAVVFPNEDSSIWRVRYGPYANASAAETDLQKVRTNGYPAARILAIPR